MKEWQYFSLQYIKASEQWQMTKDTDNKNDVTHWEYLDDACDTLGEMGWKPILLSDHIILFRRKKENA